MRNGNIDDWLDDLRYGKSKLLCGFTVGDYGVNVFYEPFKILSLILDPFDRKFEITILGMTLTLQGNYKELMKLAKMTHDELTTELRDSIK